MVWLLCVFFKKSLDKFDDVYVDHMGITEEDLSEVVLWTDRFVVHYRLLTQKHSESTGNPT